MSEHVRELLSPFVDGQLADAERRAVEAHVERCPACAEELQSLRSLGRLLARTPKAALPLGFLERLRRRRAQGPAPAKQEGVLLSGRARALAFALSMIVVALAAYDVLRGPGRVEERLVETSPMAQRSPDDVVPDAAHAAAAKTVAHKEVHAAGSPIEFQEEAPPPAPSMTNEELQQHLEQERRRMGIAAIVSPGSGPEAVAPEPGETPPPMTPAQARVYMRRMAESFARQRMAMTAEPDAVPLGAGTKPKLLAKAPSYDGPAPAAAGVSPEPSTAPPMPTEPQARAARSADELERLWRELARPEALPAVDFSAEMVVAVSAPRLVQIVDVNPLGGQLIIRYREDPETPGPSSSVRVVPKNDLPLILQPVP